MLLTNLKIAIRNLLNHKVHTILNMAGLALGVTSVFLLGVYVKHEWGYDQYLDGYQNLYRIVWENENPQTRTPHPMAQALVADFPEVEHAVSLSPLWAAGLTREVFSIRNLEKDLKFDESNVLAVDTTFFDVFPFPVLRGDARKALKNVNGILLSESMAKKYFGEGDPIGKQLAVNSDTIVLEVMAVFKDVPEQSHFHFDFLVSYVREKSFDPEDEYYTWADFGHFNYIRLKEGADPTQLEGKLLEWSRKYIDFSNDQHNWYTQNHYGFKVQPVRDIHLRSNLRWELEPNGNIEYVYIMSAAALLTLLIASINFMNLMTAKSTERAKEIGIRKTLGAMRLQLSIQFFSEAILLSLLSIAVAILLVEAVLPLYNSITGLHFELNYTSDILALVGLGTLIGAASGIYPALFLSKFTTQSILKGKFNNSQRGLGLRNGLIVFQFAISMALISGAAIIFNQLDYIRHKNIGFNKEEVVVLPIKSEQISGRIEALKSELGRIDGVLAVSAASNLPGGQYNQNTVFTFDNPTQGLDVSETFVDENFFKTMNIELEAGRTFTPQDYEHKEHVFMINETAAQQLGFDEPVGKEITWQAYGRIVKGKIVGVAKDFHFQSFHNSIGPLLFIPYPAFNHLVIRLHTDRFDEKITQIQQTYQQFDNSFQFEFAFLDERLNSQYQAEESTGMIFSSFAFIAIVIAGFGLFGMAMLSFQQRTKEVGIRKVLGATVFNLLTLLLRDFTRLILIAIVLATPVAWWMMDKWLNNFVYQVGIQPLLFVATGGVLLLVSWGILSYLTLRTSRINPSEVLKSE